MLLCYQLLWFSLFPIRINFEGLVIFLCEPLSLLIFILPYFLLPTFNFTLCVTVYVDVYVYEPYYILFVHAHTNTCSYIQLLQGRMRDSRSQEFLWCGFKVKYFSYHFVDIYLIFFSYLGEAGKCALCLFFDILSFSDENLIILLKEGVEFLCITSPSDGKNW